MDTRDSHDVRAMSAELNRALARMMRDHERDRDGAARQASWQTADGHIVRYTTSRVVGGPHDGKFLALLYRPTGPGSRSGKAQEWIEVKRSERATRKGARAQAERWYFAHGGRASR